MAYKNYDMLSLQQKVNEIDNKCEKDYVDEKVNDINTSLEEIPKDFIEIAQSSRPPKQGVVSTSPKIFMKKNDSLYKVIQCNSKQYLLYTLQKDVGGSASTDTAGNRELLRITQVCKANDVVLWWWDTPTDGTITTVIEPALSNAQEADLCYIIDGDDTRYLSNITGNYGIGLYNIAPSSYATWTITSRNQKKISVNLITNMYATTECKIYLDDKLVKTIDLTLLNSTTQNNIVQIVEIDIPFSKTSVTHTIKLENASTGKLRLTSFNFCKLKEWNDEAVNNFKCYTTAKDFINGAGANDYAFFNVDTGKWIGSYHGGETSNYCKGTWNSDNLGGVDYYSIGNTNLADITSRDWRVLKNLEIKQNTTLDDSNGHTANMNMIMNWDTDGTLDYRFSINDNTIKTSYFYTALTCTRPSFTYLSYPYNTLITDKLTGNSEFDVKGVIDGMITQYDATNGLELTSRFTQFSTGYMAYCPSQLWYTENYTKHYYGVVRGYTDGVVIPNLTWSKSLDFIVK